MTFRKRTRIRLDSLTNRLNGLAQECRTLASEFGSLDAKIIRHRSLHDTNTNSTQQRLKVLESRMRQSECTHPTPERSTRSSTVNGFNLVEQYCTLCGKTLNVNTKDADDIK